MTTATANGRTSRIRPELFDVPTGEDPKFKVFRIEQLKNAPHNPPGRIEPRKMQRLLLSIDKHGILYEPFVTAAGVIVEGHRRIACARLLGHTHVKCRVVPSHVDTAEIYADISESIRKLSGNEALAVWLINPKAVGLKLAKTFSEMQAGLGRPVVKMIVEAGRTAHVWRLTREIGEYIGKKSAADWKSIAKWLVEKASLDPVRVAISQGYPPTKLWRTITNNQAFVLAV